jgi:hypothetical protein
LKRLVLLVLFKNLFVPIRFVNKKSVFVPGILIQIKPERPGFTLLCNLDIPFNEVDEGLPLLRLYFCSE